MVSLLRRCASLLPVLLVFSAPLSSYAFSVSVDPLVQASDCSTLTTIVTSSVPSGHEIVAFAPDGTGYWFGGVDDVSLSDTFQNVQGMGVCPQPEGLNGASEIYGTWTFAEIDPSNEAGGCPYDEEDPFNELNICLPYIISTQNIIISESSSDSGSGFAGIGAVVHDAISSSSERVANTFSSYLPILLSIFGFLVGMGLIVSLFRRYVGRRA